MSQQVNQWWGRPGPRISKNHMPVKSRWWLPAISVSLLLALLVLLGLYVLRPYGALPPPTEELNTRIQMKGFELAVRRYWYTYKTLPSGSVSNIMTVLAGINADDQNPDRHIFMSLRPPETRFGRLVHHGDVDDAGNYLDGWGRPFTIRTETAGPRMVIISSGPNGVTEQGRGDDISMLVLPGR